MRDVNLATNLYAVKQCLGIQSESIELDQAVKIRKLASVQNASVDCLAFCTKRHRAKLSDCKASVIIVEQALCEGYNGQAKLIVHPNPSLAFTMLLEHFYHPKQQTGSKHTTSQCHPESKVDDSAMIAANVVIEKHAVIEANVSIGAGSYIGEGVTIHSGTTIHPNVTIYHDSIIGRNCILHSGCVIGSDGFGYESDQGKWRKIPHIGRAVLGDEVEVGANTCVDRGMLDDTHIHSGTKLDNLVHIAHNVIIGECGAIAGQSGIAGSTVIGKHFRMGGHSGINGQIALGDNIIVGGGTMITNSIETPGFYIGVMPAQTHKNWARSALAIKDSGLKKVKDSPK